MIATPDPVAAAGRAVAVVVEPRRCASALERAVHLAAGEDGELIVLVRRPRLLRGPIQLAGFDPDELAEDASATARREARRLVEELAPGLPHRLIEADDLPFRDLARMAASYRCSILVVPPAGRRAQLSRRLAIRSVDLDLVTAP
jgi:hypothetical protein